MRKSLFVSLSILIFVTIFSPSCKKNDDGDNGAHKRYAWAVGSQDSTGYGLILFSTDHGETWSRQGLGLAGLEGVDFINVLATDNSTVWAVGSKRSIFKTTDAGQNWSRVAGPQLPEGTELMSVSASGSSTVWISGSNGSVISTSDGGSSWTKYDTSFFRSGMMQGICAVNTQTIYVVGGVQNQRDMSGFIARTFDGGSTWESIELENDYNKHEWIGAANSGPDNIVIYGMRSHYAYSRDGGASWINDSLVGGGGGDINSLKMLDHLTWWAAMDYDHITKTIDGGATWADQGSAGPANMFLVGIDCINDQVALVAGESAGWPLGGKILKTSNGGDDWKLVYESENYIVKVSFVKE